MHQSPKPNFKTIALLGCFLLVSFLTQAQVPVPFSPRLPNGNMKVKGDILFVGNNILNRADVNNPSEANTPYNGTTDNNSFNMEYIDIDGDPTTFSSSSASLALSSTCSNVVYAGLYWASTYPYERSTNQNSEWQGTPRFNDWNQVKFKIPGGNYIDLIADNNADPVGQEDAIIFDGYNATNITNSFKDSPIICYKNITNLVQSLANPNGSYTLANLRAAKGRRVGASSAGWVMVIIFEDPTMPGKFISTFDGYAGVQNSVTADININGFVTLPAPFPVRAKLGVGALEGDVGITNDRLRIKANSVAAFTDVSNTLNPANNFFNSSITSNDAQVPNRTPYGTNTLGLDLDMVNLSNPLNGIIPNNETGAALRLLTSGDGYGAFLTTFAVEIIEPEIKLVKTVEDISGNDIGGADVNLGQVLDYVIQFQNIGNDATASLNIRDILPANTFFNSIDVSGAPGVTYVYNPVTGQINFSVPNNLVEVGDPVYTIRIRVQIVNTCSELTDACSNIIQNLAYATYQGVLNNTVISDDPSYAGIDSCGLGIPGPANFLVDIDECAFIRNEILCGASVVLTAGSGYASYQWFNSSGSLIGTTQSITVTSPGSYYVINTPTPPCIGITEYINVTLFGTNQTNPVLPYADEIVICPNDGEELPNIFLCGLNDSQFIQTNITDATSIIWEQLDESSCPAVGVDDCANKNPMCIWNQVGTGTNFNVTLAGQYRVVINYQNGCFNRYYFNVYTNLLDAQHIVQNIVCNTPGQITVTNVPSSYEFQLVNQNTNAVVFPYQTSPIFPIAQAGSYLIEIRQQGVTDGCVFTIPNVGVSNQSLQVNIIPTNTSCNGFGSIRVQALNVGPQYYFSISGPSSASQGPLTDNDYTFQNLNPGTYTVTVTTDDGCSFTGTTTIVNNNNLQLTATVSQHISCNQGNIQMSSTGGQPPYVYAIYSYNGVLQNPTAGDYQTSVIFDIPIGEQGDYVFIMVDSNNCTTLSNLVTINLVPNVQYTTNIQNVTCNGSANGSIQFTTSNTNGYNVSYQLLNSAGVVIATSTSGNFTGLPPGDYTVVLIQSKGNRTCQFEFDYTITQPAPLAGTSETLQAYTCLTTGTIGIVSGSVSGGTAPYQYSINGINFGASSTFTGLTAGTYTITIRDANGCILATNPITFNALNPPTAIAFTASTPSCPNLTSNVTLAITGGTSPYSYEIIAPAGAVVSNGNNPVFAGLNSGTYTFQVTDATGCVYQENYTINPVTPIAVTGQPVSNITCFGQANGALNFTVSGFSVAYAYTVVNGVGTTVASGNNQTNTAIPLTNLAAGTYTITVTDSVTGCTATNTVTINGPSAALALAFTANPITCLANGSVVATATGGWGSNQYQLTLPNGTIVGSQTSGTFNSLTLAGNYTITVTDVNNCIVSNTFALTTPTDPVASVAATSNLCYTTANSASIVVNVTGGLAPFTYSINGGSSQTSNTFSNLTPGTYTIVVTDSNGCTDTIVQVINPQLTAVPAIVKNLDCSASPDATISVTVNGGLAPFTYQISINGGAYGAATPLVGTVINYSTPNAGTYQFQITDSTGCIVQTNTVTIPPITYPDIISVTQTQAILCNGDSNGAISVVYDTALGTAPFTISVVNTTTGTNFGSQTSGLPAGNYEITITDSNLCSDTATITLSEPDAIVYNVATVDITCNNPGGTSYGEIVVENVTGGTPGYTYYVTNNFGFFDSYVAASGEDHSFQILTFGIYQVDVIDANGCSVVTSNIIIASPPDDLVIDITAVTADCVTGGTAVITVTSAVSSGQFEFAILEFNTIPYSNNYQLADPGTPETTTFTGLTPGVTYTFVVYDLVTQCYYFKSADLPIDSPSQLTATLDVVSNVSCTGNADGNVSFTFSGYDPGATQVDYEIFHSQSNVSTGITGNTTPLSGGPVTVNNFGTLPPGNYYILFTEVGGAFAGCSNASVSFTISQSTNILEVTASITKNDNCNLNAGQITAVGQFGTAPYQYQLVPAGNPAPTAGTWAGTAANVFNAEGGNYVVYIKDANNCIQSVPILLPTDPEPVITANVTNQCNTAEGSFTIQVVRTVDGIAPYSYSLDGGAFQSNAAASFSYTNLVSGTHTIEIQDANGCGTMVSVDILVPLNLTPVAATQPSCANNDGVITVTPFGGSGTYQYELQNGLGSVIVPSQVSNTFNGLGAGDYIVVISDATSTCTAQAPISLEVPTPVTFTSAFENVSCNGGSDGSITITLDASNDNPPYTYTIDNGIVPAITQNSPIFTGLPAGSYIITVTSDKDCVATETIVISEPSLLAITATATDFSCDANNTVQTATITVNIENDGNGNPSGTAPYSYSIDGVNFFPTNTFDIVDNGSVQNITITVKDNNNCTQTELISINPLPEITLATATQGAAISCNNDETVQISVTGGSGDFTFEILPAGSQATIAPGIGIFNASFQISEPGSYTFQITDNVTGCSMLTVPYVIAPFDTIEVTASNATPVTCFGDTNGTITVNVSGYTGAYSYTVTNPSGTTVASGNASTATNPFTITGLEAGNLTINVTATDAPFCDASSNTLTVSSPSSALALTAIETSNVTCDNNQGEIIATATDGWGTYLFELINNTTSSTVQAYAANNVFSGLSAGNYTVNVQDAGGCIVSQTVILVQPAVIATAISATPTSLLCFGATNATVTAINVTGGQGSYQYILNIYDATGTTIVTSSGAQVQPQFANLGAGIYSITVTDGWNCDITTATVTITEPTQVEGFLSLTSGLTCNNQAVITVSGSGGTAPYQFSTDGINFSNVSVFNVGPGTYQYYVRDANGCQVALTNQVTINPIQNLLLNLDLSSANINCFGGSTAAITANATGGLGNYTYTLLDASSAVLAGPQTAETFYDLPAGNYYVQVNSGDCEATSQVIPITDPQQLMVSYVKTDVLCFGQTNGTITISTTGGTGIIQYAISPNLDQFVTDNVFDNLFPGIYDLIVQDQSGCFEVLQIEILEPEPLEATFGTINNELCVNDANGSITVDITGGTNDYLISLDDVTYVPVIGNQHTFNNLVGDTFYMIYIRDSNDCNVNPPLEYYMEPAVEVIPLATVTVSCTNNVPETTVTLTVNTEVENDVTYSIDGITYGASNVFSNLAPGDYTGYAQHTNGCTKTVAFTVPDLLPIIATSNVNANVLCFGESTGEIEITAINGTGTLQYAISPAFVFGTANVFSGLPAGNYSVIISDEIGCEVTLTDIVISEPLAPLSATVTGTGETCLGANDGTITIAVTGGTAPYSTSLTNAAGSFVQDQFLYQNLASGNYTVYVRDANGCEITPIPFTISPGVEILPTATVADNCTNNVPGNTVTINVNPAVVNDVAYSLDGINYLPSNTYTNLAPGSYTAYVQHSNGCVQTTPFTIQNLAPVAATANVTANVLCFGQSTGAIQVNATGGTGTLQYAISPSFVFGSSSTFSNLPAGTYSIIVRDAITCEVTVSNIVVTQPASVLSAAVTGTPETCLGASDGTISIAVTGGTAPYSTSLTNTAGSFVQDQFLYQNLASGNYTVHVRDANGCEITPIPFTINPGVEILPTATVVDNCTNNVPGNTVTIQVNASVVNDVAYSLDGITYASSNTYANLAPGSYTAYVQHSNGCVQTTPFTIQNLVPVSATAAVTADVLCFGQSTGTIQVNATGGTGTLQYAISPSFVFGSSSTFSNLPAGTYSIIVRDAITCEVTVTGITVTQPAAALSAAITGTPETCLGANDGTITIAVTGGTAPYSTSLANTAGSFVQGQFLYQNLASGSYTVYVRDASGCEITPIPFTINPGVEILPTATVADNCTNNVPGNTVTINVNSAVVNDVVYSLDGINYLPSNTYTNLAPGSYTAYVQHSNGCVQTTTFTIQNLTPVAATANVTANVLCFGQSTGTIQVNATGGTGTLQYAISPAFVFGTSNVFSNLPAGTYSVIVRDAITCEVTVSNIVVTQPASVLSAAVTGTPETCLGASDGTISIAVTGGTAPYSTSLANTAGSFVQDQFLYQNLASGNYTVYVRDANGCEITPIPFTINPGVQIAPTATVADNCTNNVPGNTVTINVNSAVINDVAYSLDGINYLPSNTYTNLAPGSYTAYVQHSNGCVQTTTFTIQNLVPVAATANVTANVLCFGQSTGTIQVNATDGTGTLQYAISPAFVFGTSNVFSNLPAGTYSIIVRDAITCEVTVTGITVSQPAAALSAAITGTPETCLGANDGTITIAVTGGTAPYSTSLTNTAGSFVQGQFLYQNLASGNYTVYVRDANGCEITPIPFTINPGVEILPTATVVDNCTNNVPGNTVTINVNSAVINDVAYSLDGINYLPSNTYTNLAPGSYTAYVQHSNECVQTTAFTIQNLVPVSATANVTADVLCFGQSTGEIQVNATGGTGTLQYAISPAFAFGSSNTFSGLPAGTYSVIVRDAITCEVTVSGITVTQPAAALSATVTGTPETCQGTNDGTITIAVTGGTAPYSTSLNSSNPANFVQGQFTYQNLVGGQQYTVYVRDANGCQITPITFTINPGVQILPIANVTHNCTNNVPGNIVTIQVNASVTGSVQYSLDGVTYTPSNTFTNLAPGNYTAYVQHANGCIRTTTFNVPNLAPISATAMVTTNVLCFGQSTGTIQVNATGGTGALQYAISPAFVFGSSSTFSNLPAGNYSVIVRDIINCDVTVSNIVITQPAAALVATVTGTPETCLGANDGTITISVSGGTAPYSTSINSSNPANFVQGQFTYQNLNGGQQYTVYVRDANGCQITPIVFTITPGVNLQVTTTVSNTCNNNISGNNVTINVNPTVVNDVQYSIDGTNYMATNTFTDLAPGSYTAYVQHINGCIQTAPFIINVITPITATAKPSDVLCSGESTGSISITGMGGIAPLLYGISPDFTMTPSSTFTNLPAGTYTIRVQDATGCFIELTSTINEPLPLLANLVGVPLQEICIGDNNAAFEIEVLDGTAPYFTSLDPNGTFVQDQFLFDGLSGGQTYTVYVRDANGCMTSMEVILDEPINIDGKADIVYTCEGNIVTINVGPNAAGNVTFSLNGQTPQTGNTFTNLPNGNYTVDILHTLGCMDSVSFSITNTPALTLTVAETGLNQLTATASGGSGGYTYTFNGANNGSNNVYVFYATNTYLVTVTDSRGCEAQALINGTFIDITIPNVTTPNNDGQNDTWSPGNTINYPNITTDIFDRYGRKVATLRQGQTWDGTYNGTEMPTGDYWYLIKLGNPEDNRDFVGNFTIYR